MKHLNDTVPNFDFLLLHCFDIISSVSGINLDGIGKYVSNIYMVLKLRSLDITHNG